MKLRDHRLGVCNCVDSDAGNSMPDNNAAERSLRALVFARKRTTIEQIAIDSEQGDDAR
jgi:hypothetical protein